LLDAGAVRLDFTPNLVEGTGQVEWMEQDLREQWEER